MNHRESSPLSLTSAQHPERLQALGKKVALYKRGNGSHWETNKLAPDLDFQPPELRRNKFLLFMALAVSSKATQDSNWMGMFLFFTFIGLFFSIT